MAAWDNAPVVDEAQPAWASAPTVEQPAPSTQDTIQNALGLAQEGYLASVAPGFAFVPDVLKQGLISPETATKAVSYLPPVKLAELAFGKEKAQPGERMAGEILSGFTSPENLALMATPGIAAKLGTGIKFSELLRPSTLREIAFGKPTQPMMTPEEVGKSLGRTWRSTKEVIPSATEKGQVQEGVLGQRPGTDALRQTAEAGRSDSLRTDAQVQAKEVNPEAIKAPAVKDKFGKVIPLQPGEIHATVMTAGDTAGYITNSGEFLNFEQAAGRARAQPPTPIPTVLKPEQIKTPNVGDTVRFTTPSVAYKGGKPITIQNAKVGRVTLIKENGDIEVKSQDGGYHVFTPEQLGIKPAVQSAPITPSGLRSGAGARRVGEGWQPILDAARQDMRDAINAEYSTPRERADAIDAARTKVEELQAQAHTGTTPPVPKAEGATTAEPETKPKIISTAVKSGDQIIRGQTLNESHDAIAAREGVTAPAETSPEYRGLHTAPDRESGAPLHEVTGNIYPDDIYGPNAAQYYGHYGQSDPMDRATIATIQGMRGKPNSNIKIYRAVPYEPTNEELISRYESQQRQILKTGKIPKNADQGNWTNSSQYYEHAGKRIEELKSQPPSERPKLEINQGDWVTINRAYAKEHGESTLLGNYKIISKTVKARDIFTNGDSIHEWGYDPQTAKPISPESQRGFIIREPDGTERFTNDRTEAARIAKAAGQVKPENAGTTELHSQELAPAAGEGISAIPQPKEAAETPPAPPTEPPSPPPLPESEKPFSITSIKNAQVDQERIARGLPSATETGRKTFGDAWDQATAKIDADPNYVDTLLNELRGKPRALNDTEDAALLHRQVDLQNQFAKAAEEVNRAAATGDEGLMAENKVRLSALSDQLLDLYNIGKTSGTETARGLAMRKALAAEDFSLANMMTQERASRGGKPLTPEQETVVRARHEKIRSAQIAYDAYETSPRAEAYRRRLRSLVEQYKAGTPPERGRRLTPDREMLQLKADLEQAKTEHWQSLQKNRMAQRSGFDKARDTFAKWRRAFVLSSPNTLAKLTSAAVERLTFTPTEEAIGGLISKIPGISEVARRAPIEGGFSAKAEARALTEGFTQGMKDSWSLLKGGRSAIDVQYGPQHVLPKEAVDFVGQVHGALKTVPRQAAFERAFQKLAEAGIAKGEDVTDPLIQTRYGIEAYKEANREIFLQNNRLISLYRQMLARLEAPDKETGLVPLSSRVASTAARVFFPIVKVPTNIVAETMQYATGTVTGSLRLANAFRRGIETLKPEQAELIMRDLKKGSLGSTVMLLGYLNADKVGGYYQKGQRRSPQDVKAGHIKVFGVDIPTYLIHNPLLETLQIGATIRRVAESKLKKKDVAPQGLGAGFLAGALGLTEEVPFVREMFDSFPKLFTATERPQFLGEFAKGLFIPQAVQWAALQLDKRNGDPVKRDAQTFLQHLQSGIPGLRQNVPEKRPRSGVTQPFAQ